MHVDAQIKKEPEHVFSGLLADNNRNYECIDYRRL